MKAIIDYETEKYIENHTSDVSRILQQNYRETNLTTYFPQMLAGKVQAKFLEMVCRMIRPERVLEIGTFTAYSAIAMAAGLPDNALLFTIEVNKELEAMIHKYIKLAGMEEKIKLLLGDALQIIPKLDEQFDLVFIDADKEQYFDYYELAFEKVKPGGFFLVDNVLWNGKAVKDDSPDKETQGIRRFNEHVKNDQRVEQVILSVRDGLMLIRKL
ncbi:MAG: class I SAM-dependent methyltransferase [Bacteroidales bacterium]|nr:class I SAM-dependent methyltransferase [Bacteroidales bacterium]MCF6342755.1 class I SAM-dependent methyltransferase [Bacteroidales bacterium]